MKEGTGAVAFSFSSNTFCSAALCFASTASLRAAAAAFFSSSTLLTLLTLGSGDGVTGLVKDGVLVTSEVPKNDEKASVTGSCGSLLICLEGDTFGASALGRVDFATLAWFVSVFTGGGVVGNEIVVAFGLGAIGVESVVFVDSEMVGEAFVVAKKGVFGSGFAGEAGSLGGAGKEVVEAVVDDDAGSFATGLLPLTILPSDKRYSSIPALVNDFKATFCALFNNKFNVRVLDAKQNVS